MKLNTPTKLSFLAVILFAFLGSSMYRGNAIAVGAGNAESESSRLTELPIVEYVGLGDDQPFWETTVHIEQNQLSRSSYAALEFVVVGVWEGTSSNLIVNGREYVLPISEPLEIMDIPLRGRSVIPIPVGDLQWASPIRQVRSHRRLCSKCGAAKRQIEVSPNPPIP